MTPSLQLFSKNEIIAGVAPQHFGLRNADKYDLVASTIQFSPFSVFFATAKEKNNDVLDALDERLLAWKSQADSYYYNRLNYWMGSSTEKHILPPWLLITLAIVFSFAIFSFATNRLLKRRVLARTKELSQREAEYRNLVENANCVILRLNPRGQIQYMNSYGLRLFGYAMPDLVGKSVIGTIVPETEATGGRDLTEMVKDVFAHPEKID